MGSFRSRRLQKQHPIHLSDSEQPEQFVITPSQSPPTVVTSASGQTGPSIPTSTSDGSWFPRRTSAEVSGVGMMMMVQDNFDGIETKQSRGLEHLDSSSPSGIKSPSFQEVEGNSPHFSSESSPYMSHVNPDSMKKVVSTSRRVSGPVNVENTRRSEDQQRWSVSSDTDATKTSQIFWRYGSGSNSKSSRDSKDAEAGCLDKPVLTSEESQGGEKSIFLSVPYRVISEENNWIQLNANVRYLFHKQTKGMWKGCFLRNMNGNFPLLLVLKACQLWTSSIHIQIGLAHALWLEALTCILIMYSTRFIISEPGRIYK